MHDGLRTTHRRGDIAELEEVWGGALDALMIHGSIAAAVSTSSRRPR